RWEVAGNGVTRGAVSDGQGRVRIPTLPPGTYRVETTLPGFDRTIQEVKVASGERKTIQAPLKISSVAATVTVSSETPLLDRANVAPSLSLYESAAAKPRAAYVPSSE